MDQLVEYGLQRIGQWVLSSHATVKHLRDVCAGGIDFELAAEWSKQTNVVYAFLSDGRVRYIGETTRGMCPRFQGYRYGNPNESDTDNRVKVAITEVLFGGGAVEIWAASPSGTHLLPSGEGLELPVSKPFEEFLIDKLDPDLNVKRLGSGG